jgi:hypothetical protein
MSQPTTARHDLTIWRNDDYYEYPVRVVGADLTNLSLKMEIRFAGDTPGAALVSLGKVTQVAEGVWLTGVTVTDGVPTSVIRIRMDRDTIQSLGYDGVLGDTTVREYALLIDGRTRMVGRILIPAHAYGSNDAPAKRGLAKGVAASTVAPDPGATMAISQDGGATILIDGADLVGRLTADAEEAAVEAGARLNDFQNALAGATGYAPDARRYVGITRPLVGAPADAGDQNAWALPVQPRAMLYDRFSIELSAAGTGALVLCRADARAFRPLQAFPVEVRAGSQWIEVSVQVPAGATVKYVRLTGGSMLASGFNASAEVNFALPNSAELGNVETATATSLDYGFGASGFAIEEAPAQLRIAAEARNNRPEVSLPKRFLIGVFGPDTAAMVQTWKDRGVNAIVQGAPVDLFRTGSGEEVKAAILASGLDFIVRPGRWTQDFSNAQLLAELASYAVNPRCIGFGLPDEPDLNGHPLQPGSRNPHPTLGQDGAFDPDLTRFYYEREIAYYRSIAPSKAIFCNIQGIFQQLAISVWPERYFLASVDIWGTDDYPNIPNPNTGFLVRPEFGPQRFSTTRIGLAARQTVQQDEFNFRGRAEPTNTVGKPYIFHLATGRTDKNAAGTIGSYPDPTQWMATAFSGIINGATGLVYFPQYAGGPYIPDDSSPAILAAVTALHKRIAKLEELGALVDPLTGLRTPYRLLPCAWAPYDVNNQVPAFITARGEQLPGPFEGSAHYLANGDTLYLLNNTRPGAAALTDASRGINGLNFTGYGQRAVLASAPTVDIFEGL